MKQAVLYCLGEDRSVSQTEYLDGSSREQVTRIAREHLATCAVVEVWQGSILMVRLHRRCGGQQQGPAV